VEHTAESAMFLAAGTRQSRAATDNVRLEVVPTLVEVVVAVPRLTPAVR
jgi:hypothetical protein